MYPNGFFKITDFGLACQLSQQEPLAHGTKGTPSSWRLSFGVMRYYIPILIAFFSFPIPMNSCSTVVVNFTLSITRRFHSVVNPFRGMTTQWICGRLHVRCLNSLLESVSLLVGRFGLKRWWQSDWRDLGLITWTTRFSGLSSSDCSWLVFLLFPSRYCFT